MSKEWKVGDWVVFDLKVGQVVELRDPNIAEFSDGVCRTSGMGLAERFRPLTLQNKVTAAGFDHYYQMLRDMDGSPGFNFPDISRYFHALALDAIDGDDKAHEAAFDKARAFVHAARDYQKVIDGVSLFRPR